MIVLKHNDKCSNLFIERFFFNIFYQKKNRGIKDVFKDLKDTNVSFANKNKNYHCFD
jgi:hypothetical protein